MLSSHKYQLNKDKWNYKSHIWALKGNAMNYDNISIFIEVIKQGSFIEASKQLNMPSSTVSRRVSELESALQVRLLERNSRKIHLTKKGAFLFEQCAAPLQLVSQKVQELTAQRNEAKGGLKVTAPVLLGNEILNEWFCDFLKINQKIALDIHLSNQYQDILGEDIDVAIRIGPLKDSQFIAQYLFSAQFVMYASKSYLQDTTKHIKSIDDWSKQSLLLLKQHEKSIELVHRVSKEKTQINFKPRICSNDIAVIRQGAINGLGIAYLPNFCVKAQIKSGELVEISSDYQYPIKRDIYAVYPSKKHLSHNTRLFLDYIKQRAVEISPYKS